jgi:hypothetical protein
MGGFAANEDRISEQWREKSKRYRARTHDAGLDADETWHRPNG